MMSPRFDSDVLGEAPESIPLVGIVELLAARRPDHLARLTAKYPRHEARLRPGLTLGSEDGLEELEAGFYEELACRGLEVARDEIKVILDSLLPRAVRAKRLRLLSAIAGAVTSAGVLSAAIVGSRGMTIAGALMTFFAASLGLSAAYLETPLTGPGSIVSLLTECLELEAEISAALIRLHESRADASQLRQLAVEVNVICSKLRRIAIMGAITQPSAKSAPASLGSRPRVR
jgi:hypothetical protein